MKGHKQFLVWGEGSVSEMGNQVTSGSHPRIL